MFWIGFIIWMIILFIWKVLFGFWIGILFLLIRWYYFIFVLFMWWKICLKWLFVVFFWVVGFFIWAMCFWKDSVGWLIIKMEFIFICWMGIFLLVYCRMGFWFFLMFIVIGVLKILFIMLCWFLNRLGLV